MELIKKTVSKEPFTSRAQGNWGELEGNYLFFDILLSHTYDDMGLYSANALNWIPGKRYYKGEYVIYNDKSWVMNAESYAGNYDDEYEELTFDTEPPSHWKETSSDLGAVTITAITSSKLTGLRRTKRPTNADGSEITPSKNSDEDWMIYYMPNLVVNVSGETEEYIKEGKRYVKMINATGDIINSINNNSSDRTITFNYTIGINLQDETLQPINGTGVKYVDVYTYSNDEYKFDGNYNNLTIDNLGIFHTLYSKSYEVRKIGSNDTYISNVYSNITFTDNNTELSIPIYKEEYLLGISSKPIVKKDINMDRGINSCFEKHLKLGEIKTLQDFETFGNGYYNMKSSD